MSLVEVQRCTGACCKDFDFHFSPMQFQHMKRAAEVSKGHLVPIDEGRWRGGVSKQDVLEIVDMLVFLRVDRQFSQTREPSKRMAMGREKSQIEKSFRYHYTCKHFDGENKVCKIYETRPRLCRSFPDHGECKYRGCTRVCERKTPSKELLYESGPREEGKEKREA